MPDSPLWPASWPFGAGSPTVRAERAVVASTDRYATEVGLDVLRGGGNAIDAAVAVSFALAVVNPEAGNVGGGGFMLLHLSNGEQAALDYRSAAPRAASARMFDENRSRPDDASVLGHRAASVPGSVGGLWEAHRRFGRVPWATLVDPAIELARGFEVRDRFVRSFEPHIVEGLGRFPASAAIFLPDGNPPRVGTTFRQSELAGSLGRIRDQGADGFYSGETAARMAEEMRRHGGLIDEQDLASYAPRWRQPLRLRYRRHPVVSMPPSSSGGVTLGLALRIYQALGEAIPEWTDPIRFHLMAESYRRAFADRNHELADPDFVDAPLETLLSDDYARFRAARIVRARTTPSLEVGPGVADFAGMPAQPHSAPPREGENTTHFSIVDPEGNAAAVTTTLNTWYGSKVVIPGTGIVMNNEMDDFTARPGVPNFFGLVQGEANSIAPGKRSLSAMTPTLLYTPDGSLRMVLGTPGGATIITTVFQLLVNVVDHGMDLHDAVAAPRIHHQHLPDRVEVEPSGMTATTRASLEAMGHEVVERDEISGDAQVVLVGADGTLEGAADPRRGGVALGF